MAISLLDLLDPQYFGLLRLETKLLEPVRHLLDGIAFEAPKVEELDGKITYSGRVIVPNNSGLLASLSSLDGIGLDGDVTGTLTLPTTTDRSFIDRLLDQLKELQPEIYEQLEPVFSALTTFPIPGFSFVLDVGGFTVPLPDEFINAQLTGDEKWLRPNTADNASARLKLPKLGVTISLDEEFNLSGPKVEPVKLGNSEPQYFLHSSRLFGLGLEPSEDAGNGDMPNIKVFLAPELGSDILKTEGLAFDLEKGLSGELVLKTMQTADNAYFKNLAGTLELQNSRLVLLKLTGQVDLSEIIDSVDTNQKMVSIRPRELDFTLSIRNDPGALKPSFTFTLNTEEEAVWQNTELGDTLDYLAASLILAPYFIGNLESLVATAVAVVELKFVQGEKVALHGVRIDKLPNDGPDELPALLLDYSVVFTLNADLIIVTVKTESPLSVRYKAIGVRLSLDKLDPVYDPRESTELNISDPGLFTIGGTLGEIFQIIAARIQELESIHYIEVDIALKQDLGIVWVDAFRIRIPLKGRIEPEIQPSGVRVKVPNAIDGSGYLHIEKETVSGGIDLTIPTLHMRAYGELSVKHEDDPPLTAIYTSFGVQFPTPLPLFSSGLAIFGFGGLFGMHYKRNVGSGNDSAERALNWLKAKPEGQVDKLNKWEPAAHHWAIGARADLGLISGRSVVSATGTVLLELPGPTVSFFINASFFRGSVEEGDHDLNAKLMGFLQIAADAIALGLSANVNYSPFFELAADTTAYFPFNDSRGWYVRFGTPQNPITVKVLGLGVRGYFMVHGDGNRAQGLNPSLKTPGLSIALGARTHVLIGSRGARLFFEANAQFDMGLSVDTFAFGGGITFSGSFMLFIVSLGLGTNASIKVEPNNVWVDILVHAEIKVLFKKIGGSVGLRFGSYEELPALPLVTSIQFQSRSPALLEGQGDERPIDGVLATVQDNSTVPTIPIDAIPIIHFRARPSIADQSSTLLAGSTPYPDINKQHVPVGGNRSVSYDIIEFTLKDETGTEVTGVPSVISAFETGATGSHQEPAMALRLFTYDANPVSRAALYSQGVIERAEEIVNFTCTPIATATWITWNFGDLALGAELDGEGWTLIGKMDEDASNAYRSSFPNLELDIEALPASCDGYRKAALMPPATVVARGANGDSIELIDLQPAKVFGLPSLDQLRSKESYRALLMPWGRRRFFNVNLEPQCEELSDSGAVRLYTDGEEKMEIHLLVKRETYDAAGSASSLVNDKEHFKLVANSSTSDQQTPLDPDQIAVTQRKNTERISFKDADGQLKDFYTIIFHISKLQAETTSIDLSLHSQYSREFRCFIATIRLLRTDEVIRFERDTRAQEAAKGAIGNLHNRVPMLLEPGTTYTLRVKSSSEARSTMSNSTVPGGSDQTFTFKTDSEAPKRLTPWLLSTSPQDRSRFNFYGERPQLTLNDDSVIEIFKKYDKTLYATLKTALGEVITKSPIPLGDLSRENLPAKILTPHEEALNEALGKRASPCVEPKQSHINLMFEADLEAHSSYVLDIATEETNHPSAEAVVLRLAFETGHYKNAGELAKDVRKAPLQHAYVEPLEDLGEGQITDEALEKALYKAGLSVSQPTDRARRVLIWTGKPGEEKQAALLIDSPEPLWRKRLEPEKVKAEEDAERWCQYWTRRYKIYLEVIVPGTCRVAYAMGGTRTLIYLSDALKPKGEIKLRKHTYRLVWTDEAKDQKKAEPKFREAKLIDLGRIPAAPPWRDGR